MRLLVRGLGWAFIAAGVVIALYLVYSLYWTGLETQAHQERLLEGWELEVGEVGPAEDGTEEDPTLQEGPAAAPASVDVGEAVAALQFVRPDAGTPPVTGDPLLVVEGVTEEALRAGPGHYPSTAHPGQPGNFAVAGHRTTYGAPFFHLDDIEPGDEIHVTDRGGVRWVYEVVHEEIVPPDARGVLTPDPLGTGAPTLTLTTCHPRFSNAERLIVHAQLAPGPATVAG